MAYFAQNQCSGQWRNFLRAMSGLLSEQMSESELRAFMRALGARMAADFNLPDCKTLQELQDATNGIWKQIDWGWVEIFEETQYIVVQHRCSPIIEGLGEEASAWAPALLEGAYGYWFQRLGAGDDLVLRQTKGQIESTGGFEYRLGQPSAIE